MIKKIKIWYCNHRIWDKPFLVATILAIIVVTILFCVIPGTKADKANVAIQTCIFIALLVTCVYQYFTSQLNRKQQFENNFYSLLSVHSQIIKDFDFNITNLGNKYMDEINKLVLNTQTNFKGRYFLKVIYNVLYTLIENRIQGKDSNWERKMIPIEEGNTDLQILKSIYSKIFYDADSELSQYFKTLYHIIKMIDKETFDLDPKKNFEMKYKYTSIVRAQMSDYEVKLLFFNCLTFYGEKFKPLVERYALIQHLNKENPTFSCFINKENATNPDFLEYYNPRVWNIALKEYEYPKNWGEE